MKGIRAHRIKIKVGKLWETPILHILLTKEDNVIVARCLDFTVSSHGKDEKDALKSLADSVKEYVLTAVENDAIDDNGQLNPLYHKTRLGKQYLELQAKAKEIQIGIISVLIKCI